jgi:hypothetical protein
MANRYPLVANASTLTIQELPSNDTLLVDNLTSTGNLSVAGNSNLGLVSTVFITGGTNGQYLTTDGNGNLSFTTLSVSTDSISNGNSNVAIASSGGNVGIGVAGNANVVNVTGSNIFVTANIIPTANITYNLGTSSNRFKDLWLSNSTIYIGGASITTDGGNLVLTNPDGGQSVVSGNQTVSSNTLVDGNSNIVVNTSGNINLSANGTANVFRVTGTGVNVAGTLNATGNANVAALGASGNISAAYFIGNGSQLTGIDATAIQNGNANVKTYANANVAISAAGNANVVLVTGTGAVITGTANITGNANVGNLGATGVVATTLTGALTTANQPNITAVGTLSNLTVTGNVSAGNVTGTLLTGTLATASQPNITSVGTLASLSVTGNANTGNIGATSGVFTTVAGSLTTASQPNITSVGTLTSLTVTGNVSAGNVSGTLVTGTLTTGAQPNITSLGTLTSALSSGNITAEGNIVSDNVISRTGLLTLSASGSNQDVDIKPTGTGVVDVWGARISNIGTPTQSSDAATKQYVDDVAQGLNIHDSCQAATTGTLATATGGTITYNNGSSGVGATLTTTGSYTTIDGVNVTTVGTRILVKNEANAAHNGIYTYTSSTVITRATDFNTVPEVEAGDFVFVTGGTTYDNTGWVQTATVTTIGTDNIEFTQFSGAGTYQAGTGLTLSGTTFNISNTTVSAASYGNGDRVATFTVNAQGQLTAAANAVITANAANLTGTTLASSIINSSLTSVGTLTSLTVTGNVSAGNVSGTLIGGTLTTASQPNVTSVGTLTSLGVSGTITAANITANTGVFTGNGAGLTNLAGANVTGTVANATYATSAGSATSATTAGTVTTAAQSNITSVGTLSSLTVSGNASAGNLNTAGAVVASTLTSNVATGTAPLTVTSTTRVANLNVAYANVADFTNMTTLSTGTQYIMFANAVSGNVQEGANTIYSANIANGSLSATTFVGALSGAATTAGTVTTAAQPNITSVGTLSALTVTATITGSVSGTAATVTTAAQPNITSVGTLTSLTVTGNISAGNLTCSSGTVTAQTLTETSSITIKENFRPIENPLDVIMQLVGHIYDRKDGTTKGEAGLVAEEVAQILPNLVGLDSKGNPDSVKYSRLTVYLLESIKVLKDEIDSLKGKKRKTKK